MAKKKLLESEIVRFNPQYTQGLNSEQIECLNIYMKYILDKQIKQEEFAANQLTLGKIIFKKKYFSNSIPRTISASSARSSRKARSPFSVIWQRSFSIVSTTGSGRSGNSAEKFCPPRHRPLPSDASNCFGVRCATHWRVRRSPACRRSATC